MSFILQKNIENARKSACYSPNMLNKKQDVRILKEYEVRVHIFCILINKTIVDYGVIGK